MFHAAVTGDTWGIPGPLFLVLYPLLTVALLVGALRRPRKAERARVEAAASTPAPASQDGQRRGRAAGRIGQDPFRDTLWTPDPAEPALEELAYLSQPARAVYTALAVLLVHGAITSETKGSLTTEVAALPPTLTPLQRVLFDHIAQAVQTDATVEVRQLLRHHDVKDELNALRDSLRRHGYLRSPLAVTQRVLTAPVILLLAIALGCWRLVAGISSHKPGVLLLMEILLFILVLGCFLAFSFGRSFRALPAPAKDFLSMMQRDYRETHRIFVSGATKSEPPGFTRVRVPLSVALYGTAALHTQFSTAVASMRIRLETFARSTVGGPASNHYGGSRGGGSGGGSFCGG